MRLTSLIFVLGVLGLFPALGLASEADLAIPDFHPVNFTIAGSQISAFNLLLFGAGMICFTLGISLY